MEAMERDASPQSAEPRAPPACVAVSSRKEQEEEDEEKQVIASKQREEPATETDAEARQEPPCQQETAPATSAASAADVPAAGNEDTQDARVPLLQQQEVGPASAAHCLPAADIEAEDGRAPLLLQQPSAQTALQQNDSLLDQAHVKASSAPSNEECRTSQEDGPPDRDKKETETKNAIDGQAVSTERGEDPSLPLLQQDGDLSPSAAASDLQVLRGNSEASLLRKQQEEERIAAIYRARASARALSFAAHEATAELADAVMAVPLDLKLTRLHPGLRLSVASVFARVLEEAWDFVKEDSAPEAWRSIQAVGRDALDEVCKAMEVPLEAVPPGGLPGVEASLGEILWPSQSPEEMALARDLLVRILFAMHEASPGSKTYVLFSARHRVIVHKWLASLGLQPAILLQWEKAIGSHAFRCIRAAQAESEAERLQKQKSRRVKVAVAAALGGAALALTGGLAAPAVGAGISILSGAIGTGTVVGGMLATTGTVVASLGSTTAIAIFGAGGAGLTGWKYSRMVGAMKEFRFIPLASGTYGNAKLRSRTEPTSMQEDAMDRSSTSSSTGSSVPPLSRSMTTATCSSDDSSIKDVAEREGNPELQADSVEVVICVNGWMSENGEVQDPFLAVPRAIFPCSDVYALAWDTRHLRQLGMFLYRFGASSAADVASRYWIQAMVGAASASTAATIALPMWVVSNMARIDNAWYIVKNRTQQAAVCLAAAISDKVAIGSRPVTLVGFSMGARVIFKALIELYARGAYHVVSDVVILGAPVSTTWTDTFGQDSTFMARKRMWEQARAVVSGRFVNCYSREDWILAALYRYMEMGICVAGLREVTVDGVENIDVSDLVHNHEEYAERVEDILRRAGFEHL